ncbi:MAG: AI-2E family transporter [Planctomycetes bacterium]|nr:AI-2E family transporter [Planctomycetota bacterium]
MNTNGKYAESGLIIPSAPPTEIVIPAATNDRLRLYALAGFTVALIGLCVWLALPFLSGLAWGVAFTILAWPLHIWMRRQIKGPNWAALATTLSVFVLIVLPGFLVTYQLFQEARSGVEQFKSQEVETTLRDRILKVPVLREPVAWMDRMNIDLEAEGRKLIMSPARDASGVLSGSLLVMVQFALALFILFHFLKDGSLMRERVRGLLPMTAEESNQVFASVADSVRANIYATVVTSLINAVTGGLLFWAIGLPSPVFWAVVIFVVSILPVLGTFLIWVPAAAFMLISNQWQGAMMLIAWGVSTAILVDSLMFARLAGSRMRLHQVPSLLAFLGGLSVFGASGIILGPAILAVTVAVLEVWHRRAAGGEVKNVQPVLEVASTGLIVEHRREERTVALDPIP